MIKKFPKCPTPTLLLCVLCPLIFAGCYYDNEEYLYQGDVVCDNIEPVTYQNFVSGLVQANCNTCHNPSLPSGGVITSNYSDLLIVVNDGRLRGAVNHEPGFSNMPQGQNKLPVCDLEALNAWIDAGGPQ